MHVFLLYFLIFLTAHISCINFLQVSSNGDTAPTEWLIEVVDESVTVFLEGEGTTCDPVVEVQRLIKKREDTRK